MEKGYFSLLFISFLVYTSFATTPISYNCPTHTGTLVSDNVKVALNGDIAITSQDNYCYNYTLFKYFQNVPNVAVSINSFHAQKTNSLYLAIRPLSQKRKGQTSHGNMDTSLTTISFSLNLYQLYTKWTLIEFYFLAEDKLDIQAGFHAFDGASLSSCDSGKALDIFLPFHNKLNGTIQAYTFLNGFQISSEPCTASNSLTSSPIQIQIIDKNVTVGGIQLTLSVTSSTQVSNILVSFVAFLAQSNKIYGFQYIQQSYGQYPSGSVRSLTHSPQVYINQIWAKISGLSGFIINSSPNQISFDANFTSIFSFLLNNYWKYFSYEYVFFLGGLCSDCDGYNIYYLGQCVEQCPPQSNFNGYTCIQCSDSQVWNGTDCINRCINGKSWLNGSCVCQNGMEWNGYNCAPCYGGKVWNPTTTFCSCPNTMIWSQAQASCVYCNNGQSFDPMSNSCVCPSNYLWNGTVCIINCPYGRYWNVQINQCQCPNGTIWNGTYCTQCTGGRIFNAYTNTCDCQSGSWNGTYCAVSCSYGMTWNSYLNACQCPLRTYSYNQGCTPCGTLPGDSTRKQCLCTSPSSYYNGYSCVICDQQRVWNPVSSTCSCGPNQSWNGTNCVNSICGSSYSQVGNSCFCPMNTYQSNGQCIPNTNCTAGMMWNSQLLSCQPILCNTGSFWNGQICVSNNQNNNCPSGTYWNNFICSSYSTTCPSGTTWNGNVCVTASSQCQNGTYWTGSVCGTIPCQCPSQLVWQSAQNRCVPVGNACPVGTYYTGNTCVSYSSCKNGQIWSSSLVQCICPQNSHWNGNQCVTCNSGMQFGGNAGCFCPNGTFFNGSQCTGVPSNQCSSIQYSQLNGGSCDCLPGFDKVQLNCVCNGVINGNVCDRCTKKPNSVWTGYVCQCINGYVEVNGICIAINKTSNPSNIPSKNNPQCAVGTYFEGYEQKCLLCSDGCLSCTNCYQCQQCRPEYTYFVNSTSCVQICGDGKRFSLQCDDGNNNDNDGCSSDCKIQIGYTCGGGSPNSRDICYSYKPDKVGMNQTGQSHLYGKIVISVMVTYLPTNLTLNQSQCNQSCQHILLVNFTDPKLTYLSIDARYIKSTSYSFSIEIDFGRQPISQFTAKISINSQMQNKYFYGIDISQTLQISINPAYLAVLGGNKQNILT